MLRGRWVVGLLILCMPFMVLAQPSSLAEVTFLHEPAAKNWPETSAVSSTSIDDGQICIHHSKAGQWPAIAPGGDAIEGNPWVIAEVAGQWYAATYEWLRPGQTCKALGSNPPTSTVSSEIGPHIKKSPLSSWVPQVGETVGLFVSTPARGSERTANERSDIKWTTWTASAPSSSPTQSSSSLSCSFGASPVPDNCQWFASAAGPPSEYCDEDFEVCGVGSGGTFTFQTQETDPGITWFITTASDMAANPPPGGWAGSTHRCQEYGDFGSNIPFPTLYTFTVADNGQTFSLPPLSGDSYHFGSFGGNGRAWACGGSGGGSGTEGVQDVTEVSPPPDADNIEYLWFAIDNWPVTAQVTDVEIADGELCIRNTHSRSWDPAGSVYTRPWVVGKRQGRWVAGPMAKWRRGQECDTFGTLPPETTITDVVGWRAGGDLLSWKPEVGETVGFFVTPAIHSDDDEKSDIMWISWPSPSGTNFVNGSICEKVDRTTEPVGESELVLTDGTGFTPDDADEGQSQILVEKTGKFYTQPDMGECLSTGQNCRGDQHEVPIPTDGELYEKLTVTFDVTTNDMEPAGYYQVLARLLSSCTRQRFWRTQVRMPGEFEPGLTTLTARGLGTLDEWYKGELDYTEFTTYRYEVVYDLRDEETYINVYDTSDTLIHTVGGKLNQDTGNIAEIEHMRDGLALVFGWHKEMPDRIMGRPQLWTFSNLKVEGVPLRDGLGNAATGPDFGSDEGRLSFLAANLIDAADGDYSLDCGPTDEVPNVPPQAGSDYYCVLEDESTIAFGTFTTGSEIAVLDSFVDPLYELHVTESDIDSDACQSIDTTRQEFQECPNAVRTMKTYAFYDIDSGTTFLVFSEDSIAAFDPGIFDNIVDWFKNLFGIGSSSTSFGSVPVRRFHHGYFADEEGRNVLATWYDRDMKISYENFVTDVSGILPPGADIRYGNNKQIITYDANPATPADVRVWRDLTASLRITDAPGTPVTGGSCGDGTIDIDEQCEPGVNLSTCADLWPGIFDEGDGTPTCTGCMIDRDSCFSNDTNPSGCFDTWLQGPLTNPCPDSEACDISELVCTTPDSTCGNGELDDGEDCNSCPADAGGTCATNTCPTQWYNLPLGIHGYYAFQVSRDAGGVPALQVVKNGQSPPEGCWAPGQGSEEFVFREADPITYQDGSTVEIYAYKYTNASGNGTNATYETRIEVAMQNGKFVVSGVPGSTGTLDQGVGYECWECNQAWCSGIANIALSDIPSCTQSATCGTDDSICPVGCTASEDVDCEAAVCGDADGVCVTAGCASDPDCPQCGDADGVCPSGCTATEDTDCTCTPEGQACSSALECCQPNDGGFAQCNGGVCEQRPPRCAEETDECNDDWDCCPGMSCHTGTCLFLQ